MGGEVQVEWMCLCRFEVAVDMTNAENRSWAEWEKQELPRSFLCEATIHVDFAFLLG